MKKITFSASVLVLITSLTLFTSAVSDKGPHFSVLNANGTAASTGAPGEPHTCSQAGCHGAGNGSSSSGGLADNAGPGNMVITSIPAMTGNQYVPGTTYSMIVTVTETGKKIFGFDAEILDNSGNTNLAVNNTSGTLTITSPTKTHILQAFGTGRATVTHMTSAGGALNTASFGFNWKAPASGTVNIYGSGVAANRDSLANAVDNVYLFYQQIVPYGTGIEEMVVGNSNEIDVYPNPATNKINLSFVVQKEETVTIKILSMDGKLIRTLDTLKCEEGVYESDYSVSGISQGLYLLQISSVNTNYCRKLYFN